MRWRRGGAQSPWREQVDLAAGERVLVAEQTAAGWVVATTMALWLPDRSAMTRVGWESIDSAAWDRDSSALRVRQHARLGERPRHWTLRLDDQRDLLLVIKERVRASVVTSRYVRLTDDGGVTLVARRPPGAGDLTWAVSVDAGIDVDDPDLRGRIDAELAALRAELGQ